MECIWMYVAVFVVIIVEVGVANCLSLFITIIISSTDIVVIEIVKEAKEDLVVWTLLWM